MSMLLFYVSDSCFAIETAHILRVVPKVSLQEISYEHNFVAGLLNLGGKLIPVIDFCQLMEHRDAKPFWNTRIILVHELTSDKLIGIIGEKVNDILNMDLKQFSDPEIPLPFPFLEKIYSSDNKVIQYLNIHKLFLFLSSLLFNSEVPQT